MKCNLLRLPASDRSTLQHILLLIIIFIQATQLAQAQFQKIIFLCSDQRTYRGPEFSFKSQTKINYECYTIYYTLSFKRESLPWAAWTLC